MSYNIHEISVKYVTHIYKETMAAFQTTLFIYFYVRIVKQLKYPNILQAIRK